MLTTVIFLNVVSQPCFFFPSRLKAEAGEPKMGMGTSAFGLSISKGSPGALRQKSTGRPVAFHSAAWALALAAGLLSTLMASSRLRAALLAPSADFQAGDANMKSLL